MATLRSSPRTPFAISTPSITPRKVPHCAKCKRPRAGHPRQGCPFADPSTPEAGEQDAELENSLGSLRIEHEVGIGSKVVTPRSRTRRRSSPTKLKFEPLASLSTVSSEILNGLLKPGIMRDESSDEEDIGNGEQDSHSPAKQNRKTKATRVVMPGSLEPPSPTSTSFNNSQESHNSAHAPPPAQRAPPVTSTRSLARSLSMEERSIFLQGLQDASYSAPATVFSLPIADISTIQTSAAKLGFYSRILAPATELSKEVEVGWLVIGRDPGAVEELFQRTRGEMNKSSGRTFPLATGALVGAVAAVTGLAFA